ncbi:hypothetical protein ACLESO_14460 [Pyxidicoccus sp. 3LG]
MSEKITMALARRTPVLLLSCSFLMAGCAGLHPLAGKTRTTQSESVEVRFLSEPSAEMEKKAVCAAKLIDQVRAQPGFAARLRNVAYVWNDAEASARSTDAVVKCASAPIVIPWRLRNCPWLSFWPFMREVGANVRVDDDFFIRTYDCTAESFTVDRLAAHFVHEHMHNCGYTDSGGDGEGIVTYEVQRIVEELAGTGAECQ